ncbi:MAG: flagellar hook-basal body complex protein [Clostridiales bacterium]|nr:flagellar hook-basal body complex protein [Clostridiales bacterium]
MYRILSTGKAGLSALQEKLDLISNNIANSQTDGYKKVDTNFESLLNSSIRNNATPLSDAERENNPTVGVGSKTSKPFRDNVQGTILESENPFSLALDGEGYFGIVDETENLYLTRNGNFQLSAYGHLVDDLGNAVDAEYYAEGISPDATVEISETGEIVEVDAMGEKTVVGQIKVYSIQDYGLLIENGNGYLTADKIDWMDLETSETHIKQGYIEKSNVDIAQELVDMLTTQRAYSLNTKSLTAADEMWGMVNNMRR